MLNNQHGTPLQSEFAYPGPPQVFISISSDKSTTFMVPKWRVSSVCVFSLFRSCECVWERLFQHFLPGLMGHHMGMPLVPLWGTTPLYSPEHREYSSHLSNRSDLVPDYFSSGCSDVTCKKTDQKRFKWWGSTLVTRLPVDRKTAFQTGQSEGEEKNYRHSDVWSKWSNFQFQSLLWLFN